MIYLKNIMKSDIKNWMRRTYSQEIFKVFEIKQTRNPKNFLIRSVPHLLNHPFYLWIFSHCDDNAKPDGKVYVRSLENNTFHCVSSLNLMYDKLELEINNLLNELAYLAKDSKLVHDMNYQHLTTLMKKMKFRPSAYTKDKEPLYSGFSYVPVKHYPANNPNSHYDETNPSINFNLKKRTINAYVDGSKKQYRLYDKASKYIDYYCRHITGKSIKNNNYTIINKHTVQQGINDMMKRLIKDSEKNDK